MTNAIRAAKSGSVVNIMLLSAAETRLYEYVSRKSFKKVAIMPDDTDFSARAMAAYAYSLIHKRDSHADRVLSTLATDRHSEVPKDTHPSARHCTWICNCVYSEAGQLTLHRP
jgi:hypothetical protein